MNKNNKKEKRDFSEFLLTKDDYIDPKTQRRNTFFEKIFNDLLKRIAIYYGEDIDINDEYEDISDNGFFNSLNDFYFIKNIDRVAYFDDDEKPSHIPSWKWDRFSNTKLCGVKSFLTKDNNGRYVPDSDKILSFMNNFEDFEIYENNPKSYPPSPIECEINIF